MLLARSRLVSLFVLLLACGGADVSQDTGELALDGGPDAVMDSRVPSDATRRSDVGGVDAGLDGGEGDSAPEDTIAVDAGESDAALEDALVVDVGRPDAGDGGTDCPPGSTPTVDGCSDPIEMCRGASNVLWLDGSSYVHEGTLLATGTWSAEAYDFRVANGGIDTLYLRVGPVQTLSQLILSTDGIAQPLAPGLYEGAIRHGFASSAGVPGMDLSSSHRGCNEVLGRFQVHSFTDGPGDAIEVVASFDHYCDNRLHLIRGCIRYSGPARRE